MSFSRRQFLKKSALIAAAATFVPSKVIFARDTNFIAIRRNVGIYTNRGGTIGWLVNADASVVVDSQYPETAEDCLIGVQEKRAGNIDALINTHHHGDHTGGNGVFRPSSDIIVAHAEVPRLQRLQAQMRSNSDAVTVADTVYETEWRQKFGDETVRLRHYGPAHTSGDSVVTFENANIVHMGDLVFNRVFPFIDEAGGAKILNWILLLEQVVKDHDSDTVYIFGHGQPSMGMTGTEDDIRHMRNYLSALVNHVENRHNAGDSREDIVSMVSIDGFENHISFGPRLSLRANLEVAYNEIVGG